MSGKENMDILIIGAGTAGQTAAFDLVTEGYSVAVVEASNEPGGICALHGCQAKKYYYELTELVGRSTHLQGLGVVTTPTVSWQQVLEAKNSFTEKIPESTIANLKGNGIGYLEGTAHFVDHHRVQVGDEQFSPRFVVIATGANPMALPIAGAENMVSSNAFLDLKAMPQRVVFIGGGFISFEFAHFAARLGAKEVTILEAMERPLGPFDAEMVEQLLVATREDSIQVETGVAIESITREKSGYTITLASGETIAADLVVHGAGRTANIESLNLDAAGIRFDRRGIAVNSNMQTSNDTVYAVGDCAATVQLARVADKEAHIAAAAITSIETGEESPKIQYDAVPAVLFTYPQLGMVGKTEESLIAEGIKYWKSCDKDLSWPTYRRIGMKHAAYKILVDNSGIILGAHFIGDNVTGLINTCKQAMLDGTAVAELYQANITSPYPSRESDLLYMLEPLLD